MRVKGCCCMNLRIAGYIHGFVYIYLVLLGLYIEIARVIYLDDNEIPRIKNEFGTFLIVSYSIDALASGSLIVGIAKNKHLMLLPWLILRAMGLILITSVIATMLLISLYISFSVPKSIEVFAAAFFIIIGLFVWSWIVIYSLYHEIRNSKNKQLSSETPLPYMENAMVDKPPPYQKVW